MKSKLPSESAIVKAIRKHAEDNIEVRMVLSRPTWSNWGSSSAGTDEGMYEIRSKAKVSQGLEGAEGYMRNYWANRTIYIVRDPSMNQSTFFLFRYHRRIFLQLIEPFMAFSSSSGIPTLLQIIPTFRQFHCRHIISIPMPIPHPFIKSQS